MATVYQPLSTPRTDHTADAALARVRPSHAPLVVPIAAHVPQSIRSDWLRCRIGRDLVRLATGVAAGQELMR